MRRLHMKTLLLTREDVVRHLDALPLLEALREGFRDHANARDPKGQRHRAAVSDEGTATVLFPGVSPKIPAYSVKVQSAYAKQSPTQTSVLHLFDRARGELLAIMEASQLTALRTGLIAALAADVLAPPEAATVALIGASRQASVTLKCLRLVRSLRRVEIYDRDFAAAESLAQRTYDALQLPAHGVNTIEEAVADADLVIAVTDTREPFLFPGMLKNGAHVSSLYAGEPGKADLSANLISQSKFFCDDRELQQTHGILKTLGLGPEAVTAELGEVIAGTKPGRQGRAEVTLFSSVGLPFVDLAAAWSVYEGAKTDEAIARIDFGDAVS